MKPITFDTLSFLLTVPWTAALLVFALPAGRLAQVVTGLAGVITAGFAVHCAWWCTTVGGFGGDESAYVGARLLDRWGVAGVAELRLGLEPLTVPLLVGVGLVGGLGVLATAFVPAGRATRAGGVLILGLLLALLLVEDVVDLALVFGLVGVACTVVPVVAIGARPAGTAAIRAFALHRLGDFALVVGLFALHTSLGTLSFEALLAGPPALEPWARVADVGVFGGLAHRTLWFIAGSGVVIAAATRSGLWCWPLLRDLTASKNLPAPTAGLVHAALQGAAGIVLVRLHAVLALSPEATDGLVWVGVTTTIAAGVLALAGRDLLRIDTHVLAALAGLVAVLAAVPTTVSGLVLGVLLCMVAGMGLPWALHTLVVAVDERDPVALSGLESVVPRVHTTRLLLTAAVAVLPPFSGWVLWERVLETTLTSQRIPAVVSALVVVGGGVMALASWRVVHRVFAGERSTRDVTPVSLWPLLPAMLLAFVAPGLALLELPAPLLNLLPVELAYTAPARSLLGPSLAESAPVRSVFAGGFGAPPLSPTTFVVLLLLAGLVPWLVSMLLWHRRKNGPPPGAWVLQLPVVERAAARLATFAGRDSLVARSVSDGVEVLSRILAANLIPATLSLLLQRVPAALAWLVSWVMRGSQSGGAQRTLVLGFAVVAALVWWQHPWEG
jgi:NADH:ubiquinone oxidoreductase subunit 5 (subunit L)/multisubunit Na+/H+ antiporter MnhA subunit